MSSFHSTAQEVRVEGHILKAKLKKEGGEFVDSEIDLDTCVGNDNGRLVWANNGAFSGSAQNITVSLEGGGEPILRADVKNAAGQAVPSDLNLGERIGNLSGGFWFTQ